MTNGNGGLVAHDPETTVRVVESVILKGDISGLSPAERTRYYIQVCQSLGLNPATQPFAFLRLNGKEVMYPTRGATDQLAAIHKLNREIIDGPKVIDLAGTKVAYAQCRATHPNGRTETAVATMPVTDPINLYMKLETKAKRRATLSILGLGMLDETELETIPAHAKQPGPEIRLDEATDPVPVTTPTSTGRLTLDEAAREYLAAEDGNPDAEPLAADDLEGTFRRLVRRLEPAADGQPTSQAALIRTIERARIRRRLAAAVTTTEIVETWRERRPYLNRWPTADVDAVRVDVTEAYATMAGVSPDDAAAAIRAALAPTVAPVAEPPAADPVPVASPSPAKPRRAPTVHGPKGEPHPIQRGTPLGIAEGQWIDHLATHRAIEAVVGSHTKWARSLTPDHMDGCEQMMRSITIHRLVALGCSAEDAEARLHNARLRKAAT
jgi:hypothetical protein